ncbi:Bcr/CflA family efflux MFS transporter [Tsuneonella sp. HG222]
MTTQTGGRASLILLLAAVAALGSSAMHMLVPALPFLAEGLRISAREAQLTISTCLVAMAAGQMGAGPLVDRVGRRQVLLGGLALFFAGSVGAALAPDIETVLACRVLQGLGGAAGVVTSRVIVGDMFGREEAGRRQATLMSVVLLSPAVAPVIGGAIVEASGWREIFATLAALAAVALVACAVKIRDAAQTPVARPPLLASYAVLARNRRFVLLVCSMGLSSSAMFMFLSVSPFLLVETWGLSERAAGFCYLIVALGGITGTRLYAVVERRADPVMAGLLLSILGGLLTVTASLLPVVDWPSLVVPVTATTIGVGLAAPGIIAKVVHVDASLSGTATSLAGAGQMGFAAIATALLGIVHAESLFAMSIAMVLASGGAFLCARMAAR